MADPNCYRACYQSINHTWHDLYTSKTISQSVNQSIKYTALYYRQRLWHHEILDLVAAEADGSNEAVSETAMKRRERHDIVMNQQKQKDEEADQVRPNIHTIIIPRK